MGYLGGTLGAGMIVGSLLVGTVGSRWDKRQTILVGNTIIGLLMIVAGVFFSFGMFAPVAFLGGALLAPVMVSQDTLLHENAPPTARALIFSTKDLILAGVGEQISTHIHQLSELGMLIQHTGLVLERRQ